MTAEKKWIIQLRDSFTAGYTIPQFCVDQNIKKPLIVGMNESQIELLWEIHVQFQYDRRLLAEFALIQGSAENVNFALESANIQNLQLKNVSELDTNNYDRTIILAISYNFNQKVFYLNQVVHYSYNRIHADIPLLHFVQKNPGVKVIQMGTPTLKENPNNNEAEKKILARKEAGERTFIGHIRNKIKEAQSKGETIQTPYDFLGYSNEYVYNLLEDPGRKINIDGSVWLNDNKFLKIENGKRSTAYQPKHYKNKIYFVGNCIYYGYGVPWDRTVESYLQKLLNEKNLPWCVENESQFTTRKRQDTFYILDKLPIKFGDIVFVMLHALAESFPILDVDNLLNRPHNYGEVFPDTVHINENGHKAWADYIFKVLVSNNFFKDTEFKYPSPPPPFHRYGIPKENLISPQSFLQNAELEEYKKKLREKRFAVGAIVMNCNPFTLGHEYLVEYASKRVKKLFIFVVEEDKSEFKFADRFELVKRGVKKFSNVEVLPSGKFIISQQTFSGYFNKENLQNVAVDSSEDVEIFAREIAPTLGITVRFVGEEPEDSVTRQYNENMKRILPQYNIELCEIPRKILNGEVISAKKVREALHEKNFDKIKKLVPKTTLKFLLENFN